MQVSQLQPCQLQSFRLQRCLGCGGVCGPLSCVICGIFDRCKCPSRGLVSCNLLSCSDVWAAAVSAASSALSCVICGILDRCKCFSCSLVSCNLLSSGLLQGEVQCRPVGVPQGGAQCRPVGASQGGALCCHTPFLCCDSHANTEVGWIPQPISGA
jgi:hypothetical protein